MYDVHYKKSAQGKRYDVHYRDAAGQWQSIPAFATRRDSVMLRDAVWDILHGEAGRDPGRRRLRYMMTMLPAASLEHMIALGLISAARVRLGDRLVDDIQRYAAMRRKLGAAAADVKGEARCLVSLLRSLDWYVWEDVRYQELSDWYNALPVTGPRWNPGARPRDEGTQDLRALLPFADWRSKMTPDAGNPLAEAYRLLLDQGALMADSRAGRYLR